MKKHLTYISTDQINEHRTDLIIGFTGGGLKQVFKTGPSSDIRETIHILRRIAEELERKQGEEEQPLWGEFPVCSQCVNKSKKSLLEPYKIYTLKHDICIGCLETSLVSIIPLTFNQFNEISFAKISPGQHDEWQPDYSHFPFQDLSIRDIAALAQESRDLGDDVFAKACMDHIKTRKPEKETS